MKDCDAKEHFFLSSLTQDWLADLVVEKTMNQNSLSIFASFRRWKMREYFWVLFQYDQCLADLDVQKSKVLWRYPSCKAHWDFVCRTHYSYSNHMTCTIKLSWINIICPSVTISYFHMLQSKTFFEAQPTKSMSVQIQITTSTSK